MKTYWNNSDGNHRKNHPSSEKSPEIDVSTMTKGWLHATHFDRIVLGMNPSPTDGDAFWVAVACTTWFTIFQRWHSARTLTTKDESTKNSPHIKSLSTPMNSPWTAMVTATVAANGLRAASSLRQPQPPMPRWRRGCRWRRTNNDYFWWFKTKNQYT